MAICSILNSQFSIPLAPVAEESRLLTFVTPLFRYRDFDQRVAFVNAVLGFRIPPRLCRPIGGTAKSRRRTERR
jgi:hypothetical protein